MYKKFKFYWKRLIPIHLKLNKPIEIKISLSIIGRFLGIDFWGSIFGDRFLNLSRNELRIEFSVNDAAKS